MKNSSSIISIDLFKKYQDAEKAVQSAKNAEFSARTKLGQAERAVRDAIAALAEVKKEFPPDAFADVEVAEQGKSNLKDEALLAAAAQVVNSDNVFRKSNAMAKLPVGVFRDTLTDQDVDSSLKRLMKAGRIKNVDRGRYRLLMGQP